jgi:hypothetical protein
MGGRLQVGTAGDFISEWWATSPGIRTLDVDLSPADGTAHRIIDAANLNMTIAQ